MKRFKRILSVALCLMMLLGVIPFTTSAQLYPGVAGISRKAAAEGIVMLKNDNGALPLDSSKKISVFGRIQVDYFAVGYGSGGDVKYPYTVNLLDGMRQNPKLKINETLARVYEKWCKDNPPQHGSWGNWPRFHEEMPLAQQIVDDAAAASDVAVVVIGRSAGEDRESTLTKGSYYLTDKEVDMLNKVTAAFDQVIVLMNVGNVVDMQWLDNYADTIDSVLFVWQGGMESGSAVADVLSGDETPSGKLAATIAKTYNDYPSSTNFGQSAFNNYAEDIFVGYRYFETFAEAKDKVKFGFGYGLSYTTFDINTTRVETVGDEIQVDVTVTNTGSCKGKEVVQIYYGAPQGVLGKAAKSLSAYAKTNLLQPGKSEDLKLSFKVKDMASYDDAGKTGHRSAWVLEQGEYPIYVGNSVRSSVKKGSHTESALRVVEQLSEAVAVYPAANAFDRWTASEGENGEIILNKTGDRTPTRTINLKQKVLDEMPPNLPYGQGDKGIKLLDVYEGRKTMEEFVSQISAEQLVNLTRGAGAMGHANGIPGNASVYGGSNSTLKGLGIPSMSTTDGPSGIRMTASATLLPVGTTLACTWNDRLVEELYAGVGAEMLLNGSDALLAPGMNLQRDPLCGRNFEYFSEDPLLTGQMGANTTRGVQSQGVSATPKHFAANNQETNRNNTDSRISERALREIYLKGFEICVKTAKPQNLMMSYNKVNGVWAYTSYELATVILRQQWGYTGCIMTDWWITSGSSDPDFPGVTDNAYRVRAGVDVLMPGDRETQGSPLVAFNNGLINIGEIQRSAIHTLNFAMKSARFRQDNNLPLFDYQPGESVFKVQQAVQGSPKVDAIYLDGKLLDGFHSSTNGYSIFSRDMNNLPTVTATAPEGTTLEITQATAAAPYATVIARLADGGETIYRVFWTNQAGLPPTVPNPIYAVINNVYINGQPMLNFYRSIYSYKVWVEDPANVTVTADAPKNVDYTVTREGDTIILRAESPHQAMEYILNLEYFTPTDPSYLPKSDEFDAGPLNSFWTVGNQTAKFSKEDGHVKIIAEPGDWYQGGADQHNYVWQHAKGNWVAITKASYDIKPFENYQQIGVMVYQDSDNFLQLRLEYNNWDGNQAKPLRFSLGNETAGTNAATSNTSLPDNLPASGPADMLFRVTKNGNVYRFDVSVNDGATWTNIGGNVTKVMAEPKFSLLALTGNTTTPSTIPTTCTFDYVRFSDVTDPTPTAPTYPVVNVTEAGTTTLKTANDHFYMTSGLGTENTSDKETPGQNVGWTSAGQFLVFNVNAETAGTYNVVPRIASNASSVSQISFGLHVNGEIATTFNRGGGTGGWQNWISLPGQSIHLKKGLNKVMLYCNTGDFNINTLKFNLLEADPAVTIVAPEKAVRNESFQITITTAFDFAKLRLRNEPGNVVGSKLLSKTDNGDGTFTTVVETSVGTLGEGRVLSVYLDEENVGSFTFDSVKPEEGIVSLLAPESAAAGDVFQVSVVTTKDLIKGKFYNEFGRGLGSVKVSNIISGDYRTIVYEIAIDTPGMDRSITFRADFDKQNTFPFEHSFKIDVLGGMA